MSQGMSRLWKLKMAGKQTEGSRRSCHSHFVTLRTVRERACAVLSHYYGQLSHSPRTVAQNLDVQKRHPGLPGWGLGVLYFMVGCTIPLSSRLSFPTAASLSSAA